MIELGLQRISRLAAQTPFPWRAIHVAGTNGKGSICAYISAMLEAYNLSTYREKNGFSKIRHGRFTSPHLMHRWDSITIHQQTIAEADFLRIEKQVLHRNESHGLGASEFEIQTATAFEAFTNLKLDVAVVEVGLGGRLDATNILGQPLDADMGDPGVAPSDPRPAPLVTAIAHISMDHEAFLGNSLTAIAREKAGIIKPGVPVVFDESNQPSVAEVIEQTASSLGSPLVHWSSPNLRPFALSEKIVTQHGWKCINELIERAGKAPQLVGRHTQNNFGVAYRSAWLALKQLGRIAPTPDESAPDFRDLSRDMSQAALNVVIPGRQESLDISPLVGRRAPILLDGAHNERSATVLSRKVRLLREQTGQSSITWVLAASDTKDLSTILRPLLSANDSVFAVEFGAVDGMPWVKAASAAEIVKVARTLVPDLDRTEDCGGDVLGALQRAAERSPTNLVVAGSLYLVGNVHRLLATAQRE